MPGTKAGWAKARAKLIERFGSEEAYFEWVRERGSKGGVASSESADHYGFHRMTPRKVSAAGRKGGTNSRRNRY